MRRGADEWGIRFEYTQPGNPQHNAYVERFNRTVRYEWLSQYHWHDLDEARLYATNWMWILNHYRLMMALDGITPKQRLATAAWIYFSARGIWGVIDKFQCAFVLSKLNRFNLGIKQCLHISGHQKELLAGFPVKQLLVRNDRYCVYAQFAIQVSERSDIKRSLLEQSIPAIIHYPTRLHKRKYYESLILKKASLITALP